MLFSFIYIVYESFYDAKFEPAYWLATITCACQVAVLNHVPVLIIHIFFIIYHCKKIIFQRVLRENHAAHPVPDSESHAMTARLISITDVYKRDLNRICTSMPSYGTSSMYFASSGTKVHIHGKFKHQWCIYLFNILYMNSIRKICRI